MDDNMLTFSTPEHKQQRSPAYFLLMIFILSLMACQANDDALIYGPTDGDTETETPTVDGDLEDEEVDVPEEAADGDAESLEGEVDSENEDDVSTPACLTVHSAALVGTGADLKWNPGEMVTIVLTLTNACVIDMMEYPAAKLTSSTEGIQLESEIYQLYGIFAGQSVQVEFRVSAADDFDVETVASFTAEPTSLACERDRMDCPPTALYNFDIMLEEVGEPVLATDCLSFSELALRPYIGSDAESWEPDVTVAFEAVMTNTCERGIWTYPGARLSADLDDVVIDMPDYFLYGIDAGMSVPMAWAVTADTNLSDGTVVVFTVEATAINCSNTENPPADCPDPNPESITRTVGDLLDERE